MLSNSIFVTARSCVNSHDRWYAELKLPGAGYAPIDTIQGSKKMGYNLVMIPSGFSAADFWYKTK